MVRVESNVSFEIEKQKYDGDLEGGGLKKPSEF